MLSTCILLSLNYYTSSTQTLVVILNVLEVSFNINVRHISLLSAERPVENGGEQREPQFADEDNVLPASEPGALGQGTAQTVRAEQTLHVGHVEGPHHPYRGKLQLLSGTHTQSMRIQYKHSVYGGERDEKLEVFQSC